ncbi:hypothetical protein AMTR_s00058p00220240 [Amborella trichopoda]|uniref:Uncharacterized protein n=1 Tax=Amborella trichopoda TaxID=13333 RepID=W1PFJ5_AMBTC|nr:hypothetical protein AMTR_s00058p00220240 [Amborella trichopoda]
MSRKSTYTEGGAKNWKKDLRPIKRAFAYAVLESYAFFEPRIAVSSYHRKCLTTPPKSEGPELSKELEGGTHQMLGQYIQRLPFRSPTTSLSHTIWNSNMTFNSNPTC